MTFARTRRMINACMLLAAAASTTEAQVTPSSFEQLRVLVGPGDTIAVTPTTGQEVTGTIAELSSSSIGLLIEGTRRDRGRMR